MQKHQGLEDFKIKMIIVIITAIRASNDISVICSFATGKFNHISVSITVRTAGWFSEEQLFVTDTLMYINYEFKQPHLLKRFMLMKLFSEASEANVSGVAVTPHKISNLGYLIRSV